MPIYYFNTPTAALEIATTNSSTGWLSGGVISINADPTLFDVSEVKGIIVDDTDPSNVIRTPVHCAAQIGVTPTLIADHGTTFLYIDDECNLVQSEVFPDSPEVRSMLQIGSIVHPDNATITGTSQFLSAPISNLAASMNDLQVAMGAINKGGNVFSGNSGTLGFDKTAGRSFYMGIDLKSNPTDPNHKDVGAESLATFIKVWRDGAGGFNIAPVNQLTTGVYDNNSGGVSDPTDVLSTNAWTNTRIYYSPDAEIGVVQYGQTSYNSSTAAINSRASEPFEQDPDFVGVPLRCIVTHRGGALDFSLVGDAIFTEASPFGALGF